MINPIHSNPIVIWVYPHKWGWPDLPHSNRNRSNSHSQSCLIQGILFLQTNTLALLLHLVSTTSSLIILTSSCPSLQTPVLFSNMPIIPSQHMPIPSHSICLCHLNHCFLQTTVSFTLKKMVTSHMITGLCNETKYDLLSITVSCSLLCCALRITFKNSE